MDFFLFFIVENWLFLIPYVVLVLPIKGAVSAFNHHHQHHKTFRNRLLNHILEFFYFLHTGPASNVWLLQHNMGHHINYKEPLKDEARWMADSGHSMGVLSYTFTNSFAIYGHVIQIGKRYPKLLKVVIYHHILGILLLGAMLLYHPYNAVVLFVFPMLVIYIFTIFATYDHHADLDTATLTMLHEIILTSGIISSMVT